MLHRRAVSGDAGRRASGSLHTFHTLNLPSTETSKGPLMLGSTDAFRTNWTLEVAEGRPRRRTTFTRGSTIRHDCWRHEREGEQVLLHSVD